MFESFKLFLHKYFPKQTMEQSAFLFSTRGSLELAQKIADQYGQELGKSKIVEFSDGEFVPAFEQPIRGARVFLIGSTMQPTDNLMELLLMCDAAKRASAKSITVAVSYTHLTLPTNREV